jgi:hypothetical protein
MEPPIKLTEKDVLAAQQSWAQAVVEVGLADRWEAAHARATKLVSDHYILDGSLLFCPTKASLSQFRQNLDAAVSYFVGNNMDFHEDTGFALQPWSAVRFENFGIQITGDFAVTMGNYFFQNAGGVTLKAEYTLVYRALQGIGLRIVAHHSAIPFEA